MGRHSSSFEGVNRNCDLHLVSSVMYRPDVRYDVRQMFAMFAAGAGVDTVECWLTVVGAVGCAWPAECRLARGRALNLVNGFWGKSKSGTRG
jgi:hypothetical protein